MPVEVDKILHGALVDEIAVCVSGLETNPSAAWARLTSWIEERRDQATDVIIALAQCCSGRSHSTTVLMARGQLMSFVMGNPGRTKEIVLALLQSCEFAQHTTPASHIRDLVIERVEEREKIISISIQISVNGASMERTAAMEELHHIVRMSNFKKDDSSTETLLYSARGHRLALEEAKQFQLELRAVLSAKSQEIADVFIRGCRDDDADVRKIAADHVVAGMEVCPMKSREIVSGFLHNFIAPWCSVGLETVHQLADLIKAVPDEVKAEVFSTIGRCKDRMQFMRLLAVGRIATLAKEGFLESPAVDLFTMTHDHENEEAVAYAMLHAVYRANKKAKVCPRMQRTFINTLLHVCIIAKKESLKDTSAEVLGDVFRACPEMAVEMLEKLMRADTT